MYSVKPASYRPGQGLMLRYTPTWESAAANSTQYWGIGLEENGYFFGYFGTSFGIMHRINSVDYFTAQISWNGDRCDGTNSINNPSGFNWNTANGIPMMIKYPYLGHGNITFWVLNPNTGTWILCHMIKYANTSPLPQLTNPNLHIYGELKNNGSTTNKKSYLTCAAVLLDGPREYLGPQFGVESGTKTITTENNMLTLKSCTYINTYLNEGLIRLRSISACYDSQGAGNAVLRVKKNATLGGSPSFTPVNGSTADQGVTLTSANSIMSYDIAGTTVTGGITLYNATFARQNSFTMDLTPLNIVLEDGDTLTFSMSTSSSGVCTVAVNWQEDVQ